jgi:sigma-B regulation protein RsbU (phosphoserine phosphatase)
MALYLNAMGSGFGALQRGLVVSTSAAVALLAAMILLFARLPQYLRSRQLEQQLAVARQVQQDLLSPVQRFSGNLEFAAACVPAFQVGGDFYDVYVSDGRVAMVLGDVSGKGLPAALLMGLVHGGIRCSTWIGSTAAHETASVRLNELLHARTSVERFVSLFWGYYDAGARTLSYVNAGHWPPLLVRAQDPEQACRLEEGGPVLGILPKAGFRQGTALLNGGDVLVIYSDGVVEAADREEREFGEERLRALVAANRARTAPEIMDEILKQLRDFVGQEEVSDDLTLLVVRSTA